MSRQRDIELFIVDIFVAIEKIKEYTSSFKSADDFAYSSLHWDASIRQLEIIGEALNKLLEDDNFNSMAPKYFRRVVNFRNHIVHGYFGIDTDEVWNIITQKLQILNNDLTQIIKESDIDLSQAILSEIEEYNNTKNISIVQYLMSLSRII